MTSISDLEPITSLTVAPNNTVHSAPLSHCKAVETMINLGTVHAANTLCACCKHTVHAANILCMLQTHRVPAANILCMLQTKCVHAGMQ